MPAYEFRRAMMREYGYTPAQVREFEINELMEIWDGTIGDRIQIKQKPTS